MPTIRYEIRNEYGLADPELHRAADKDDPEAVLEGVAMAGLVGVLRQLGDLAEFAAEIFHDLHEEVMSTAARGHGLMLRVQQLEAEFPSLEKAFFSQSNHSSFTYNDGTDWHANVQLNQNLVTQGDMPRFILDSYEECRGPPRLFMLDKFDIAGAGACLKRYSDPSFFKMELASSSGMAEVDIPREKRYRKMKKKGPRWKNGKTLESLLSPKGKESSLHLATLGQVSEKPATRLVQLKPRHLNRDKGRSFVGRLLELHSDMQKVSQDTSRIHLNRKLDSTNLIEQDSMLHDIVMDKSISHPSPKDENALTANHGTTIALATNKFKYEKIENGLLELPSKAVFGVEETENGYFADQNKILADSESKSGCSISHSELGDHDKDEILEMKKQVLYDCEINLESSGDGDRSDDVGSEQENFMDALNTMESEVETDSDSKNIQENFDKEINTIELDSVEGLKELNTRFSEQQYVENSFPVHMNSNMTNVSDSANSDTLNHLSKKISTKEVFFSSNQDQDLANDLGESHDIINDEIWPKVEVHTLVNLNSNDSGLRSEPEEVPCSSFPMELTSIPNLAQECSDELLSHVAVQNYTAASYSKQLEGRSRMNDQDREVSILTDHVNDLASEIMTGTIEMSTHLSPTSETSTENYHGEHSLFTSSMPTVSEMQEPIDRYSETSLSYGNILSATTFLDNINIVAPQSNSIIAEIQNSRPLEYPLADATANDIRETNDASNNILNSSIGAGVVHEDENCSVEQHAEALVYEVMDIRHNSPDNLSVFKDEVDEEVFVGYNEDASVSLTMQERESQEVLNEDTTIRCRLPDRLLDMKDEGNIEVALGYDEDLSLPLTMQDSVSGEALNEDKAIRCDLPNQIRYIQDEDNKEVYLKYDDPSPLTMHERESHKVLNEDIAIRCDLFDHHPYTKHEDNGDISVGYSEVVALPSTVQENKSQEACEEDIKTFSNVGLYSDLSTLSVIGTKNSINEEKPSYDGSSYMKHEDNGDISVGYSEVVALPLTVQESKSQEACEEDIKTFSNVGLYSDLSTLSVIGTKNAMNEEKPLYDGSSFDIMNVNEMPVNNTAMLPELAHFSDTELQPSDKMSSEEERTSFADVQLHLGALSGPVLPDDKLESEIKYSEYDSEKEGKQIEQNFLSDEVSNGVVSTKDVSHESAHLDSSSALSSDISSSKKQFDEDCVSSLVTPHLHELKVHETCHLKDTDPLDSQTIPCIDSSSPEEHIEQNFLSDEVSSGIFFAKYETHESAHLDPSSVLSPDISSSKKQLNEDCFSSPVTSHHEMKFHDTCNQKDNYSSDSQRISDINSSSPETPESGAADLGSDLFAENLSSDKDIVLTSYISCSQTESLPSAKETFSDDYSLERKHGDVKDISLSTKFLLVSLHEESPKLEVRHEENDTKFEEHLEQEILTNSTGFDNSLPPSRPSIGDVDCYNRSLDITSSIEDTAKHVESDAFTSCTSESDLSMMVLPELPRLSVTSSKSTMRILDDNESDQSSIFLPSPDVENPPPLPPLPPIGWRTGKLHEKTLSSYANSIQHVSETCSHVPSSTTEDKAGLECGRRVERINHFAKMMKLEDKSFQHGLLTTEGEHILPLRLSQLPPIRHDEMDLHNQFLLMPNVQYEECLHDPNALSGLKLPHADSITLKDNVPPQLPSLQKEKVKSVDEMTIQNEVISPTELERVQDSQHGNVNLDKELTQHQNLFVAQSNIENETYHSSQGIDIDIKSLEPRVSPVLEVCHPGYVVLVEQSPSDHYGVIWASEAELPVVRPSSLRNRPRNPLIEAVAAHDRSTMRKVSELVRPQTNKSEERNSLLEQIRNKAFSLKPATSTKQNMKTPHTNLKVAAIIEKANAIRQACAGSDEDDDADGWSDS